MQNTGDRIILGIDPGTNLMGYGVIDCTGKHPIYMDMGVIDLKKSSDHYMKKPLALLKNTFPTKWPLKPLFMERTYSPC